jgi:tellurium resistance protein TerD
MKILTKGENISLKTSQGGALEKGSFGLGWDGKEGKAIDVDLSILLLTGGKHNEPTSKFAIGEESLVYYGRKTGPGIQHSGDNRDGAGEGDDETVIIDFNNLPTNCTSVLCLANIYEGGNNFGSIANVKANVYEGGSTAPIATMDLTEDYSGANSLIVAEFYKHDGAWKFKSCGEPVSSVMGHSTHESLGDMVNHWNR